MGCMLWLYKIKGLVIIWVPITDVNKDSTKVEQSSAGYKNEIYFRL